MMPEHTVAACASCSCRGRADIGNGAETPARSKGRDAVRVIAEQVAFCVRVPSEPSLLTRRTSAPRASMARALLFVRVLWGTVLLIAPEVVLRDLPHQRIDRAARGFARVLGARHLTQAAITSRDGTHGWAVAGAVVDALHAATMAALAALRPDRRKLALTNFATATTLAAAGLAEARRG